MQLPGHLLHEQRRERDTAVRGLGGTITALLTGAGAKAGVTTPFLTPAGDRAARVYLRIGYRKAGEMLHISLR